MRDLVMSFHSTHQAIVGEKTVKEQRVDFDMIPTPRQISAGCGLSLELSSTEAERWLPSLHKANVVWGGIYKRDQGAFLPWEQAALDRE